MIQANKLIGGPSTILGAGLVALDVILNGAPTTPAKLCAGGSCGNVLTILSFLGWSSKPIARLSDNGATKNLFKDFKQFTVNTSLVTKSNDGKTPIIIHRILKDKDGNSQHKFEFKIPGTNVWLPMYKPVLANYVDTIVNKQPKCEVFYFDRVSRSTIELARHYSENGALIIFEPSSLKDDKQTMECLELAHVIKFSSDRINNYSDLFPVANALLEIKTLGKDGLEYRLKSCDQKNWKKVPSYKFENIKDSAGAGDWCTAGIINEIGFQGLKSFSISTEDQIINALKVGQALGGLNCMFDGARGLMYNMDYNTVIKVLESIASNKPVSNTLPVNTPKANILTVKNLEFNTLL
ncbi:fructokinase [Chryseobacterium soldanellicola]|uniref:Fructokinase n=1 Tax=Chryseobacterium soldanellicola TaxID=311333 RepID=A0A1H1FE46_9FLAO|nr:carbohydrate kinase family protein [Chryseobacterium soldanellicola]SDQ99221.1 fructokinase [Chryseobacterium soldanellicola]